MSICSMSTPPPQLSERAGRTYITVDEIKNYFARLAQTGDRNRLIKAKARAKVA